MSELKALLEEQKALEKKIAQQRSIERSSTINNIIEQMKAVGINLSDLQAELEKRDKKHKSRIVRYSNPETGATWSGRGKRPKWIVEAIEAGRDIEDYSVK